MNPIAFLPQQWTSINPNSAHIVVQAALPVSALAKRANFDSCRATVINIDKVMQGVAQDLNAAMRCYFPSIFGCCDWLRGRQTGSGWTTPIFTCTRVTSETKISAVWSVLLWLSIGALDVAVPTLWSGNADSAYRPSVCHSCFGHGIHCFSNNMLPKEWHHISTRGTHCHADVKMSKHQNVKDVHIS
jgi:hypothetical protein